MISNDQIKRARLNDPILHAVLTVYEQGGATYIQALEMAATQHATEVRLLKEQGAQSLARECPSPEAHDELTTLRRQLAEAEERRNVEVGRLRELLQNTSCRDQFCTEHGTKMYASRPHTTQCRFADALSSTTPAGEWLAARDERIRSEERERCAALVDRCVGDREALTMIAAAIRAEPTPSGD